MSTVWLVDDSDVERVVAKRALEKRHQVTEFPDGTAMLEHAGTAPAPDVLVMDYQMPGLTGTEVTQHLRKRYDAQQLPILILSGTRNSAEDVASGLQAGANDYVFKPFSEIELMARVESLVQSKHQRERANRAERSLRKLLQHLADAFIAIDDQGRITYANRAAERVLAREWSALLTQPLSSIIPGLQIPADLSQRRSDVVLDGRVYELAFGRLSIDESFGETTTLTLRDVTDKALAIDRRDRFLAMLAHELRNPLAPILTATQLMYLHPGDAKASERGREVIHRQVERLIRIVDDLLDVSRVSRGRIEVRPEVVDLAQAVERAIESCQPLIDSRNHRLSWTPPATPLRVLADPIRFEQMLTNLLNNAAKYTAPGGNISIVAEAGGTEERGLVVVRMRDDGVGIAPNMLESIFEMFVQVDESLQRSEGGLGIGLPLVRQLAAMQGGSVHAESKGLGCGSEFVLTMPAARGVPAAAPGDKPRAVANAGLRVLMVDDNEDAVGMMADAVQRGGHEVRVAYDGVSALAAASEFKPDVVFLDIGLPGLDGYEVAKQLRQDAASPRAFLVALSGYGRSQDIELARQAGFDRHVLKPASLEAIDEILALHATSKSATV